MKTLLGILMVCSGLAAIVKTNTTNHATADMNFEQPVSETKLKADLMNFSTKALISEIEVKLAERDLKRHFENQPYRTVE